MEQGLTLSLYAEPDTEKYCEENRYIFAFVAVFQLWVGQEKEVPELSRASSFLGDFCTDIFLRTREVWIRLQAPSLCSASPRLRACVHATFPFP